MPTKQFISDMAVYHLATAAAEILSLSKDRNGIEMILAESGNIQDSINQLMQAVLNIKDEKAKIAYEQSRP